MIKSYYEMMEKISCLKGSCMSVAAAQDRDILEAVYKASAVAGVQPILFGSAREIERLKKEIGYTGECKTIDEPDDISAARAAVRSVHDGEADVLMKGLVNTSDYLRAVLDKNYGLRSGKMLSHLAAFEIPGRGRMLFVTDGGFNIAPTLEEKKIILHNALGALRKMGYAKPNVAVVTANEQVSEKAVSTVHADAIARAGESGEFGNCVVEGPIAFDVAVSKEAARHKNIDSRISGEVDLILVPAIEVGNVLGKCLSCLVGARMSGVVLGAAAPIVLTSRSEDAESKLNSILLASSCI
ncbi:MAG: phosphate butyryltransferase [Synergistaceae bacterium]|jgi:phosphate butyryltransferase|nr:phosphate butyryltransferase [Synergistaceae bacterium]